MKVAMKKIKLKDAFIIISGVAFWGLIMPASLFGILGIPIVFFIMYQFAKSIVETKRYIRKQFKLRYMVPMGLIYYILVSNFYTRWILSGAVQLLAATIGINVSMFLAFIEICMTIISLLFFVLMCCVINEKGTIIIEKSKKNGELPQTQLSITDIVFCGVFTLCFSTLLALNPWSNGYPGIDSSVFIYIGKKMQQGAIPYVDLFDHKGIVLYLLQWLGASMTPDSFTGIWVVEIVNLFFTAIFILKITRLFSERRVAGYFTVILSLSILDCFFVYEGGNLTEEYALPWIIMALFVFLKYFIYDQYMMRDIVWLGIGFAIVFFLRVNMVTVWAAFLPVVLVGMIWKKQWKALIRCIIGFLAGSALVFGVLTVYMMAIGCFDDMLKYYFVFNFGYRDSEGNVLSIFQTMAFLLKLSFGYVIVYLVAIKMFYKNSIFWLNLWFTAVSLLLAAMSGRTFYHYGIMLIPTLIVPAILVFAQVVERFRWKHERYVLSLVAVFFVIQLGVSIARQSEIRYYDSAVYLKNNTREEDNVLVIGNACSTYLQSRRSTSNKYFYQTPPINVSDEICQEFVEEMKRTLPDTIMVIGDRKTSLETENNLAGVCEMLDSWVVQGSYTVEQHPTFFVYHHVIDDK